MRCIHKHCKEQLEILIRPKVAKLNVHNNRAAEAVLNLLHALQSGNIGDPILILAIINLKLQAEKDETGLLAYGQSDLNQQTNI